MITEYVYNIQYLCPTNQLRQEKISNHRQISDHCELTGCV